MNPYSSQARYLFRTALMRVPRGCPAHSLIKREGLRNNPRYFFLNESNELNSSGSTLFCSRDYLIGSGFSNRFWEVSNNKRIF